MRGLLGVGVLCQLAACRNLQADQDSEDAKLPAMVKYNVRQTVLSALACPCQ